MRMIDNVTEKIKDVNVNPSDNATLKQMMEIINDSDNQFELFSEAFQFGYMQGVKAEKAERRRDHAKDAKRSLPEI